MQIPKLSVSLFGLSLTLGTILSAQTGTLSGTVADPTGGVIPAAQVTATNAGTGIQRTAQSNEIGAFVIPSLPAGKYDIAIEKEGFTVRRYAALELNVAQQLSLSVTLEPGKVSETIEVSGSSVPPVDLEASQLSNVVDQRRIVDLPLLTRNPYDLILLSPGTTQSNSGLGGFSVNGARERNNNFLLDGTDNNDTSVPGIPGGLASLNPDATQEFRVITSNFLPEFGRNTGAIIDIVTKSGTNSLHGSGYWFGRYAALGARDFFNVKGNPQDPYVRNDFGFSVGGPVIKDKTFFFFNDEYQRYRTTLTNSAIVPTAAFKSGVFTYQGHNINLVNPGSPNNVLQATPDPLVQKILANYPNPNGEAVDDVRGIYRFASPDSLNNANLTFRLDHHFSDKHNFYIRYAYTGATDSNQGHFDTLPGVGGVSSLAQIHGISANLVSAFRPTIVNEFRFGVNRADLPFNCTGLQSLDAAGGRDQFGSGTDYAFPGIAGWGCGVLGDSNAQTRRTGTYSLIDNMSWNKGNHNIKFGGEFRYIFENGYDAFGSRQALTFNGFTTYGQPIVNLDPNHPCDGNTGANCGGNQFQDLAAAYFGIVDTQAQSQFFDKAGTRTAVDFRQFRQHEYGLFVQDTWKVTPHLTLNYGLRYQFNGVPLEIHNNLSNLYANPQGPGPFTFSLVGPGEKHLLYNNDALNFEPRFGFNWDPLHKGKTSIRGGIGVFHDRVFGNLFGNAKSNPPFLSSIFNVPNTLTPASQIPPPATVPPSAVVPDGSFLQGAVLFDQNLKMPYNVNWNFGIQQELPARVTLELNYVGTRGVRQLRVVNGNQPLPALVADQLAQGVPPAALQFVGLYTSFPVLLNTALYQPSLNTSIGNSSYQGLQMKATRRLTQGLQIQAAYTWAHAIDDASDPLNAAAGNRSFPRNSFNLREERGNSDFDIRQRMVLNYIYELPFGKGKGRWNEGIAGRVLEGWEITGISSFQSGHPYDIFGNVDSEHTGFSSRGDLIGTPSIPSGSPSTQTGPSVTAFDFAPFGRPGNIGRNTFVGPRFINTDATLIKNTSINERFKAQLRFEFYNIFNRTQFGQPGNLIQSPGTFGVSTSTIVSEDQTTTNRQIQMALKVTF